MQKDPLPIVCDACSDCVRRFFGTNVHHLQKRLIHGSFAKWLALVPSVGVTALAEAINRATKLPVERGFLLAELCLELHQVVPQEIAGSLSAATIRGAIRQVMNEIRESVMTKLPAPPTTEIDAETKTEIGSVSALRNYIQTVFEEGVS